MSTPSDDARVVSIAALRTMTPAEIVTARQQGRLDLGAIADDRARRDRRRTTLVRQFIANGAEPAEAITTAAEVIAFDDGADLPPAT